MSTVLSSAAGLHWSTDLQADLGLDSGLLQAAFFQSHWQDIVTGRARLRDRLAPVLRDIAPSVSCDRLIDYWFRNDARLNGQLIEDLTAVRKAGVRVHLATNQEHERAAYLLDTLDLSQHIDVIHYSAALGCCKPSAGFFAAAGLESGAAADEIMLVHDMPANVEAARRAGWRALQWTGAESLTALLGGE